MEGVKLFVLSNSLAESALDQVESDIAVDLGRSLEFDEINDDYLEQFELSLRKEAKDMSRHYHTFYCLERSIRQLITDKMETAHGSEWWDTAVPTPVQENVRRNVERERDEGFTQRSEDLIDYTTFGELGDIVRQNWDVFDDIFSSQRAFNKIMKSLNVLRGPIAHCCPLAEDEVVRLGLTVKDWFRLME